MRDATFEGEIMVTAETPTIDTTSAELKGSIGEQTIQALPVGQQYRDLIKLIPGVQYSEDTVRGPSAGGNGQDNVYEFDGVGVNLPLFGTLATQPAAQDVEEMAVVKGGANAVGFNRSGGFLVNTLSKSGSNQFHGEAQLPVPDRRHDRLGHRRELGRRSTMTRIGWWPTSVVPSSGTTSSSSPPTTAPRPVGPTAKTPTATRPTATRSATSTSSS